MEVVTLVLRVFRSRHHNMELKSEDMVFNKMIPTANEACSGRIDNISSSDTRIICYNL
jgi:hypothetical protein